MSVKETKFYTYACDACRKEKRFDSQHEFARSDWFRVEMYGPSDSGGRRAEAGIACCKAHVQRLVERWLR